MQKARRHPDYSGLRPLAGVWFQGLFTPLLAVLFTFPSRYLFTIGLPVVFSLTRWCWQFQTGFLRPRPTQDSHPPDNLTCTGLSPSSVTFSKRVPLRLSGFVQVLQPPATCDGVWAFPRSLATTCRITIVFSSSGYLDVSVPRVCFPFGISRITGWVAPFGNLRVKSYLRLTEAYRSLSRPSSPLRAKASSVCS